MTYLTRIQAVAMALVLSAVTISPILSSLPAGAEGWVDRGLVKLRPMNPANYNENNDVYSNTPSPSYNGPSYGDSPVLRGQVTSIPAGSEILVRLEEPVSSQINRVGDSINATLDAPLMVGGRQVAARGAQVMGSVVSVSEAGRLGKHGEIEVRFHTIQAPFTNEALSIDGVVVTKHGSPILKGDSYKMDVAKGIGIAALGTGVGAVGGTAVGGLLGVAGTGAVVGTAAGAIGGIGYAVARRGRSVDLPKGTHLKVRMINASSSAM